MSTEIQELPAAPVPAGPPAKEVVEPAAKEAVETPAAEVEQPTQEVAKEPAQKVAKEPAQKVAKEPAQEVAEQPRPLALPLFSPPVAHAAPCANCRTPIVGRYCHECGQTAHVHRSMLHIFEEAAHGVLHFEAKAWRTLPLLFVRPGLLTRRYIDGQRVRYVSPLALFLFCVFVLFFASSLLDSPADHADKQRPSATQAQTPTQARAPTTTQAPTTQRNETARSSTSAGEESLLKRLYDHARANPQLTAYKMKSASYKFAFLLVPLTLPFLWLMFFWRKDVRLYDHAIYTLYSLSFMSLWFVVLRIVGKLNVSSRVVDAVALYVLVHVFLQLKETYLLGWGSALWRTIVMFFLSAVILLLFAGLVFLIAVY